MTHWVLLATASNQLTAEMWRELLHSQNLAAMIRVGDTTSFLGISAAPCRIMVPEDQLQDAKALLTEQFGPEEIS
ncbi:DUF2007 domain-containing protein [Dehalococcoidia bacterium]|nr:DUF2007 domain-containing protein [Dehalococcoidia bacterium]